MKVLRLLPLLLLVTVPVRSDEAKQGTTLQQTTRDAEERIRQFDEADDKEQARESKYWWLGFIQLALSAASGRGLILPHGFTFHGKSTPVSQTADSSKQ